MPAWNDLCDLVDVKHWLQIGTTPFPATDDILLKRLITAASEFIADYLGRQVALGVWRETHFGIRGTRLGLANTPITAVSSLTIGGTAIQPMPTDGSRGTGYGFNASGIYLAGQQFTTCCSGGSVIVEYTAGYETIPAVLQQACIELVALRYRERTRIGEVSKQVGGETVTYLTSDMSEAIRSALNPYRRVVPVSGLVTFLGQPEPADMALNDYHWEYIVVPPVQGTPIVRLSFAREHTLLPNMIGSVATAGIPATDHTVFDIEKNGLSFGTMVFVAGASSGSFATTQMTFAFGDVLTITPRNADLTLQMLSGTIIFK
ncbi:MAG: phage head-tail connector protein [Alphaproteobacteria bacterium]